MPHLDDGLIHELVDGEVPSARLAPIQEHLAGCPACQARLETARSEAAGVEALLEALDEPAAAPHGAVPLPVRRTAPRWGRQLGLAASLLVAVGVGYGARDVIAPITEPARTNGTPLAAPVARDAIESAPTATTQPPTPLVEPPAASPERRPVEAAPRDRAAVAPQVGASGRTADVAEPMQAASQEMARAEEAVSPPLSPAPAARRSADANMVSGVIGGTGPVITTSPQRQSLSAAKAVATPTEIDFASAIARLGGSLRLVDGLVPRRLEALGDEVRVIYQFAQGDLILSQERVGTELRWKLTAPEGFPPDSLATLRGRVRP